MHSQQVEFVLSVMRKFPKYFNNVNVIDFGSGDINGNNRQYFQNSNYIGVDVAPGRNVDIVSKCHETDFGENTFDVVISTEMLEHDPFWDKSLLHMYNILKSDGILIFTCATTGRHEHGTKRTSKSDSFAAVAEINEFENYYRNITFNDVSDLFRDLSFQDRGLLISKETHDLYFYGIKS